MFDILRYGFTCETTNGFYQLLTIKLGLDGFVLFLTKSAHFLKFFEGCSIQFACALFHFGLLLSNRLRLWFYLRLCLRFCLIRGRGWRFGLIGELFFNASVSMGLFALLLGVRFNCWFHFCRFSLFLLLFWWRWDISLFFLWFLSWFFFGKLWFFSLWWLFFRCRLFFCFLFHRFFLWFLLSGFILRYFLFGFLLFWFYLRFLLCLFLFSRFFFCRLFLRFFLSGFIFRFLLSWLLLSLFFLNWSLLLGDWFFLLSLLFSLIVLLLCLLLSWLFNFFFLCFLYIPLFLSCSLVCYWLTRWLLFLGYRFLHDWDFFFGQLFRFWFLLLSNIFCQIHLFFKLFFHLLGGFVFIFHSLVLIFFGNGVDSNFFFLVS